MRFNEFNEINEDIGFPGKPQPGGKSDGVVSYNPMKLGPIKYDAFTSPLPTSKQSPTPKLPANYQIAPNMRPQPGPAKPGPDWTAKSALNKYQDPADISQQQQPAYQRKGVNAPITTPKPGTKPSVNLADPRQAAAYNASINAKNTTTGNPAVWKNNRTGATSSTPPASATPTNNIDRVGMARPGEPTMGQEVPVKPAATTAPSQYQRAMNTVANMRKGFGKSNEYTNIYAPLGPTSFQNKQYIQDLEKEFRKTPNDPIIRAELDKMRGPGIVAAKGTGTSGGRTTNVNDPRLSADIRPGSSDIRGTGRGPGMQNDTRLASTQTTQTPTTAVKPIASTGTSAPAQATSTYKGSQGAQAIQQANIDKIADVNKITAGDVIKVGGQDYTIKQGDTLDSIAKNQLAPSSPSASTDSQNDRLPDEDVSSVQADESKSLNRIKSLAGLE